MSQDLSELFAASVREVMPVLRQRGLGYTYAEPDLRWRIEGGGNSLAASLGRLYDAAAEMLQQGFLAFDAKARPSHASGCALRVRIGGTGRAAPPDRIENELRLIPLAIEPADPLSADDEPHLRRAQGRCAVTGAQICFSLLPRAGFMFTAEYQLRQAHSDRRPGASRRGAAVPRVWIVGADREGASSALRQAQDAGASALLMPTMSDVLRRLRRDDPEAAQPALVVMFGSSALPIAEMRTLHERLRGKARCVYAVEDGSPHLRRGNAHDFDVRCHPFSGRQWLQWIDALAADAAPRRDPATNPWHFALAHQRATSAEQSALR